MRILLLLLSLFLWACASGPVLLKRPYLWKASKEDKIFYLFGTFHANRKKFIIPEIVQQKVKESNVIFVELYELDINRFEMQIQPEQEKFYDKLYAKAKEPYYGVGNELSESALRNVKYLLNHSVTRKWLEKNEINIEPDQTSPYLIEVIFYELVTSQGNYKVLSPKLIYKYNQYKMRLSEAMSTLEYQDGIIDDEFNNWGVASVKAVRSLDNVDEVIDYYRKRLQSDDYLKVYTLNKIENLLGNGAFERIENINNITNSYIEGSVDKKLISQLSKIDDFQRIDYLLTQRNKTWYEKLKLNDHNTIFVAAGLMHFIGKDNLLDKFKADGFRVEKVIPDSLD